MTPIVEEQDVATEEEATEQQPMWELAECTCPDWCERDHETD
jgi:hypothetical protein